MLIATTCMIPLAFIAGVFCALKSVQVGLKWQIETKQGKEPTLEVNPIKPITEAVNQHKQEKVQQYTADILKEWMYGEVSK